MNFDRFLILRKFLGLLVVSVILAGLSIAIAPPPLPGGEQGKDLDIIRDVEMVDSAYGDEAFPEIADETGDEIEMMSPGANIQARPDSSVQSSNPDDGRGAGLSFLWLLLGLAGVAGLALFAHKHILKNSQSLSKRADHLNHGNLGSEKDNSNVTHASPEASRQANISINPMAGPNPTGSKSLGINPQQADQTISKLSEYISKNAANGYPVERIKSALLNSGWPQDKVEQAAGMAVAGGHL